MTPDAKNWGPGLVSMLACRNTRTELIGGVIYVDQLRGWIAFTPSDTDGIFKTEEAARQAVLSMLGVE